MFCLIFAGEAIFSLPFHLARFFRPTMLEAFALSNARLGDVYAVYGITAMLAYFPGGALADLYSPRILLTGSLLATAAGGIWLASFPSAQSLAVLYGYWGLTTILLFWAALIRATREWGGLALQGRAFGVLDGGRGLVAATLASVAVTLLSANFVAGDSQMNKASFALVIYFYTGITALAGVLCWWVIPTASSPSSQRSISFTGLRTVLLAPRIWCQAAIVIAAYCGYKGLDYYTLYAQAALGLNDLEAATLMTQAAYLRPIAAVSAGLLADRLGAGRMVGGMFVMGALAYLALALGSSGTAMIFYANLFVTIVCVYGLRGIYFALLEESGVPRAHTGTAVGVISVIGYTPDIFFAPIAGRLLDAAPRAGDYASVFILSALLFSVGALSAYALHRTYRARR
ncbi:MAG: MFS transporter [Gammaproteobacteria bacterium]|nr:MFS transporter [Gammaproteobacteria bacterium]